MKSNKVHCQQILDCIAKIESFTQDMQEKDFFLNEMAQSAVIMQLALIGELSKKLSIDFKEKIDLPWREISGFRDMAIHDYYELKLPYIWLTIQEDIPTVKKALDK